MAAKASVQQPMILLEGTITSMNGASRYDSAPTFVANDAGVGIDVSFDCTATRQREKRRPIVVLLPCDARAHIAALNTARLKSQTSVDEVFTEDMFGSLKSLSNPAYRAEVREHLEASGFNSPGSHEASLDAALAEVERSIAAGSLSIEDRARMIALLQGGGGHEPAQHGHHEAGMSESYHTAGYHQYAPHHE